MFDFAPSELLVLGAVALLVIPPKDLPKAMRMAGTWMGRVRRVAGQFRSGFDSMIREAELQEMEKKWAAENERIMREHPPELTSSAPMGLIAHESAAADEGDQPPVLVEPPVVTAAPPSTAKPDSDPAAS